VDLPELRATDHWGVQLVYAFSPIAY
jgi:hypothetical protein